MHPLSNILPLPPIELSDSLLDQGHWQGELCAMRKDGSVFDVQLSGNLVTDENGTPLCMMASFVDITERKQMEQQLQLAGRLAAVGELSAGVAHELNNPLAAVQAYAQFLSARDDLDESIKMDVETIYKEAQRATKITENLLSFARRRNIEKEPISINEVLERSLKVYAYRMEVNSIQIMRELNPDLPMIRADSNQIQQVFTNIIINAEQAMMEAHGTGKLIIKTGITGDMIRIEFTDNGPGILQNNLKAIFDPFFTTKGVGKGTGLGLSICYGIVQEHGGHLYCESKPGKGATFIVALPVLPLCNTTPQEVHSQEIAAPTIFTG